MGDREPPNVSIIFDAHLRVRASTQMVETYLSAAGYQSDRDRYGLNVYFAKGDNHLSNAALTQLLQDLASVGVVFAMDFKQMVSPADLVEMLIEGGAMFDSPRACAFDGMRWLIQDHPWPHY